MKILYVITKANWGGAQRYVYDLATAGKKRGYEVAVAYGEEGELGDRLRAADIATFKIDSLSRDVRIFADVSSFRSLLKLFRSFNPDIVHLNSSKIGGLGALAARLAGIRKIIFTAHAWAFNEDRPYYQKIIIAFLAWATIMLSTKTITVSGAMNAQISKAPGIRRKLYVIRNGSATPELLSRAEARAELVKIYPKLLISDLNTDFWVGTVAELHRVKGLRYAIDAIERISQTYPNIRYLILGQGQQRHELEESIRQKKLQANVFLLGHVKDAPRYAKAYDVFLLPSLSEAFGIALLEAGLAELPVIATRVGGIPEIIENETSGLLVPPKNSIAIAHDLEVLRSSESARRMFGRALYAHVSKFTLARMEEETFKLYQN